MLIPASNKYFYYLFIWSKKHNIINIVDQCDVLQNVQMVKVLSDFIIAEARRVNIALGQDCKWITVVCLM